MLQKNDAAFGKCTDTETNRNLANNFQGRNNIAKNLKTNYKVWPSLQKNLGMQSDPPNSPKEPLQQMYPPPQNHINLHEWNQIYWWKLCKRIQKLWKIMVRCIQLHQRQMHV